MTSTRIGTAVPAARDTHSTPMSVYVVSTRSTFLPPAIEAARRFTRELNAHVIVLAAQVVPYPLDLNRPPVKPHFAVSKLQDSPLNLDGVKNIRVVLCRDETEGVLGTLAPRSLVVIGARKRFWRTREESLAGRLRKAGHQVVVEYA